MRNPPIAPGEYYHVFNRSNGGSAIFRDTRDYAKFLFLILHLQSPYQFRNMGRLVNSFIREGSFGVSDNEIKNIAEHRLIELVCFILMPNHFHLLIREIKTGGTASYLQRFQNSYTKYFNTRYETRGHLFSGPYRAVHISSNEQLLHLSAYIHKNISAVAKWRGRETSYPYSSYSDYINHNRWSDLLSQKIIADQFRDSKDYRRFVEESSFKKLQELFSKNKIPDED